MSSNDLPKSQIQGAVNSRQRRASSPVYTPQLAAEIESRALPTGRQVALELIPII